LGWKAKRTTSLLPVAGEVFTIDFPLYRTRLVKPQRISTTPKPDSAGIFLQGRRLTLNHIAEQPSTLQKRVQALELLVEKKLAELQTTIDLYQKTSPTAAHEIVIEDNAATGQLIQSQLASSGYETIRCDRPEHAKEMAA
jgi:hypothetical protein